MSASYTITIVPPHKRATAFQAVEVFLASLGFRVTAQLTQEQPNRPINYPTNRVVFIGAQRENAWIPVVGWDSELRFDSETWRRCNPLAAALSAVTDTAVHLWTHNAGAAAGYSVFLDGRLREGEVIGELAEVSHSPLSIGVRPLLGAAMDEPGFVYREFMRRFKNWEQGTAAIAARFGLDAHLTDVMDLVDGNGGIMLRNGRFEYADILGWTGVLYDLVDSL